MHNNEKTFLFYDYETFSPNKYHTRIASVAMVRTTMDLEQIGEPIVLYCKLGLDFLPHPESCLIHGLSPQFVNENGVTEDILIAKVLEEFSKENTIVVGYNSINFDDEVTRATLYRNLIDPFTGWAKDRWDIIKLVRAVRDYKPATLKLEKLSPDTGWTSFHLPDVAEQNEIEQTKAHDALFDVLATIGIAKLIKEKQSKMFDYYLEHRTQEEIDNLFATDSNHEIILYTNSVPIKDHSFTTHPLLPLYFERDYYGKLTKIVGFDLSYEVPEEINEESTDYMVEINTKKCPFIIRPRKFPAEMEAASGLDWITCLERQNRVLQNPAFSSLARKKKVYEKPSADPEVNIYEFPSSQAKEKMRRLLNLAPSQRLKDPKPFTSDRDQKFNEILFRHVARNYTDSLTLTEKQTWIDYCRRRITGIDDMAPEKEPLYLSDYYSSISELENEYQDGKPKELLTELREYGKYVENMIGLNQ